MQIILCYPHKIPHIAKFAIHWQLKTPHRADCSDLNKDSIQIQWTYQTYKVRLNLITQETGMTNH